MVGKMLYAASAVAALAISQLPAAIAAAPGMTNPRATIMLSEGWRFKLGDEPAATQPDLDTRAWQPVSVPHSWNRVGYYVPDPEHHVNHAGDIVKTQGVGWYRLTFTAPAAATGRHAWLQFDAASRKAEVWLNGIRLGEHLGGFSRFRFNATAALRPGRNLLVVKVDNSEPKPGSATADILPLVGDFFVRGGLYRPVELILTENVHFDLLDYGGPGVYVTTSRIAGGDAALTVRAELRNDSARPAAVRLVTKLIDAQGKAAAQSDQRIMLEAHGGTAPVQALQVPRAHLWQGTADPYLYTLRTEIRSDTGKLLDALDQPFGIRQIRLDPAAGLFLNGRHVALHGVGMHQDQEGKDWAMSPQDVARSVDILRTMGANTIRLTHYQHGQPVHDIADRTGLILWDEIPLVTAWTLGAAQPEASPALVANARQQLEELIHQNFNHPSVAVWGIANEVDFGASRPDFLGKAPPVVPDPMALLRDLDHVAKTADPSRPTVLANCCEDRQADAPVTAAATDAFGVNRYFGWYYGMPDELGAHLDTLHAKRPQQPMAVTEYGAGGATTIHTDDPHGGPVDAGGHDQPEEYQSWIHEQNWAVLATKPYLWANWLWVGFDFASTVRREGDSVDINTKGLVTYDRAIRKDAYYFYQANWTATPTVHINGRRYTNRAYPVTEVRVYSNSASTRLEVNGVAQGTRTSCPNHVCVWPTVRLREGSNRVVAIGGFGGKAVRDAIDWTVAPAAARSFRIDSGALVAARAMPAFGSDAFFDGGEAGTADQRGGRGRAPVPATITGPLDRDLAATFREGDFHYRLPVGQGHYRVTLSFVELAKPGSRHVFDVLANGTAMLSGFDPAQAAGGPLKIVQRSFDVAVAGDMLDLHFRPAGGAKAIVSAVEVVPAS